MYIATCIEGLEEIAAEELKGKKVHPGKIEFAGEIKDFSSIKDISLLWKKFKFGKLEDIAKEAEAINEKIDGSFKVFCHREGEQNFSSMEVEKQIGEIFYNKGFKVDLKKPENIIFIDIKDEMCFIGLLIRKDMNKREYRFKHLQPNLDCTIAYAMAKLAEIKENEVVSNPYCRDGVLAIEAAKISKGRVYCNDSKNNLRNAEVNVKLADVDVKSGEPEKADKVLAILPSYVRRMSENKVNFVLERFFEKHKDAKRIVAVSGMEEVSDFKRDFQLKKKLELKVGESKYFILVYEK